MRIGCSEHWGWPLPCHVELEPVCTRIMNLPSLMWFHEVLQPTYVRPCQKTYLSRKNTASAPSRNIPGSDEQTVKLLVDRGGEAKLRD